MNEKISSFSEAKHDECWTGPRVLRGAPVPAGGAGSGGPGRRIALPLKPIRCALEAAQVLAGRITATAPVAVRMAKTLLREGGDAPLSAGLQLEQAVGAVLYATDDAKEGIAAFVGKRKPEFRGQ